MKYRVLLLTGLILFTFGCKKLHELTQFDMDYDTSITIPKATGINSPINIPTPDITTNSESSFENNNTNKDLVEKIVLKSMQMTIGSPKGEDFSFLKSIEIKISADSLPDIKIAWKDNISASDTTFALETSDADLKDYLTKDKYKLKVKTTTDEILMQDHVIDIHSVFFVDAEILGF